MTTSDEAARWPVEHERRDPRRRSLREEAERVREALDPVLALRDVGSPDPDELVEPAARPAFAALGDPHAVARAEEAWRKARGRESGEAAARVALGEALFVGGDPSCLGHFEAVVRSLAEIDARGRLRGRVRSRGRPLRVRRSGIGARARQRDGEPRARRPRSPIRGHLPADARASRPAGRRRLRGHGRRGPSRPARRRGNAGRLPGSARHGDRPCRAGPGRPGGRGLPHRGGLRRRRPARRDAGALDR